MSSQPLAQILRPKTLAEFIGQTHLVGETAPIKKMIDQKIVSSMILWGPPASGKTTLANILAVSVDAEFLQLSAVLDGKEELRKILEIARKNQSKKITTILFIDEIHRWNKAQQDALLTDVEHGNIVLIGATTENPSFSINSALMSRCRVFTLHTHTPENILKALEMGWSKLSDTELPPLEALTQLAQISDGDIRYALNTLQLAWEMDQGEISLESISKASQRALLYDKNGEEHYNLISAVHKSLRSSNPTAGVYWIVRMLTAGEDPRYIARRLVRFASEDIGNANPNALLLANQVYSTVERLGMPEAEVALVQLAQYLANSPKDNSAYIASVQAHQDIQKYGSLPVPLHFRNAPTKFMQELGYGKNYQYDHDLDNKQSKQECMPDKLTGRNYFKKMD